MGSRGHGEAQSDMALIRDERGPGKLRTLPGLGWASDRLHDAVDHTIARGVLCATGHCATRRGRQS